MYTINPDSPSVNGSVEIMNGKLEIFSGDQKPEAGKFRTVLPQILASTAKNFLLLDLGMAVAFPTIVIPALRGLKNRANDEFLNFTPVQASWFGEHQWNYCICWALFDVLCCCCRKCGIYLPTDRKCIVRYCSGTSGP